MANGINVDYLKAVVRFTSITVHTLRASLKMAWPTVKADTYFRTEPTFKGRSRTTRQGDRENLNLNK